MSKLLVALVVAALGLVVGVVNIYLANANLSELVVSEKAACEARIEQLTIDYKAEINDLRDYLLAQYNRSPAEQAKKEKPKFTKFVSRGHRVRAIGEKYEFIIETALVSDAERETFKRLLYERERAFDLVNQYQELLADKDIDPEQIPELDLELQKYQEELANYEAKIQILLQDPVDYQRYMYLREREL